MQIDVNEHTIQRDNRAHKVRIWLGQSVFVCTYVDMCYLYLNVWEKSPYADIVYVSLFSDRKSSCINLANTIYEIKKSFIIGLKSI